MRRMISEIATTGHRYAMAIARRVFTQAKVFVRHGPVGTIRYVRLAFGRDVRPDVFANGLATPQSLTDVKKWHLANGKPLVVVLMGSPRPDLVEWATALRASTSAHFLSSPDVVRAMAGFEPRFVDTVPFVGDRDSTDLFAAKDWMHQHWRRCDLLFVDLDTSLINSDDVLRLQFAAHQYERETSEIGFVVPALDTPTGRVAGYEWDRATEAWVMTAVPETDYGQAGMPRYVLSVDVHGFYVNARALDTVNVTRRDLAGMKLREQLNRLVAIAWKQNIRTLAYAGVALVSGSLVPPATTQFDREWLADRHVVDEQGRRRIIFVLPATSISGGIKTVFEQSGGLVDRGFEVEIWALQGPPTWMVSPVPVKTYRSYSDLLLALRNEEAIKVATWWETAQVVLLASVNTGIPVFYVQEFETWFYPDNARGRAAVASSYRREFANVTIADFQKAELKELGIAARTIHSGYDSSNFKELPEISRRDDTMMAVGRSFFQKNFAMTLAAWLSLGDRRPRLSLYGFEPDLVNDDRATYEVRPSNERVNELYNEATFFVQTSLHEGFSLPIIEAMAAGCPVITTDSHGNRDFCFDGENCLLVEQNDVPALAAAIELLMNDSALRDTLRANGLKTARKHTWSVILDQLQDFYSTVE